MAAELAILAPAAAEEPSAALRRGAVGAGDHAGDLLGEALPDGVDEPPGLVAHDELIVLALGERVTSNLTPAIAWVIFRPSSARAWWTSASSPVTMRSHRSAVERSRRI